MSGNLVVHAGGRMVSRSQLEKVPCPSPEGRWFPIPFAEVAQTTLDALAARGYSPTHEQYALSRNDQRMFGVIGLTAEVSEGVNLCVGIRSSHDRSLSLSFCAGSRVFVCDNLAFRSERVVSRRHTINGREAFQRAMFAEVEFLAEHAKVEGSLIGDMIDYPLSERSAEAFLLQASFDTEVISTRQLPLALELWRKGGRSEYGGCTLWRLFNCLTFVLGKIRESNPPRHLHATMQLWKLAQDFMGLGFMEKV